MIGISEKNYETDDWADNYELDKELCQDCMELVKATVVGMAVHKEFDDLFHDQNEEPAPDKAAGTPPSSENEVDQEKTEQSPAPESQTI